MNLDIEIDHARFEAAGLVYSPRDDRTGEFRFQGAPDVVLVRIVDGKLRFVVGRSAGQKQVLAKLGITP